jgi:hypothetical protein
LADARHVISMGSRYQSTGRRFDGGRDATSPGAITPRKRGVPMSKDDMARKDHVDSIHDSISERAYEVNATAVAEAIVRRLLEGRLLPQRPEPRA